MLEGNILKVKRLEGAEGVILPQYAYENDAGFDLCSSITCDIKPFERRLIPTGFAFEIPVGFAGFIQPRSGLSHKSGLTVINTPGLVDSGYRGEIKVSIINLDPENTVHIEKNERIAQMVIQRVESFTIVETDELCETNRGTGGFGSSGTMATQ